MVATTIIFLANMLSVAYFDYMLSMFLFTFAQDSHIAPSIIHLVCSFACSLITQQPRDDAWHAAPLHLRRRCHFAHFQADASFAAVLR